MAKMKALNFNDNWRYEGSIITLPHDAMLCAGRDKDAPSGSAGAFFKGGVYEYEKVFSVPESWRDMTVLLNFGGVYRKAKVYINGKYAGGCAYGYSEFTIDIAEFLDYGADNTVKVTADNSEQPNSRCYSGGGIYRPVSLLVGNKEHIEYHGIRISTLSYFPVRIRIETKHTGGEAAIEIMDDGKTIATGKGDNITLELLDAKLWSEETPNLYQCRVTLFKNSEIVDEAMEMFGIRLIEWSGKRLFINGKETLLRGGCVHCDDGILGAVSFEEAEERRVRILKTSGFNALRISHNPASTAMLDACDKYGLYAIDETWDMWYKPKSIYDYAHDFEENYKADVATMVAKDYNHPCVIMYSIGNEISEPATVKGIELTKELVALCHSLDATRPVTAGVNLWIIAMSAGGKGIYKEGGGREGEENIKGTNINSTLFNMITQFVGPLMNNFANSKKADRITTPCIDALDIAGYNYASGRYKKDGNLHPERIIFGSETLPQDIYKNWVLVKKLPHLIGDFLWAAWDYLGEAGLGSWAYAKDGMGFNKPYPWLLSECGVFDILGNPTGELFLIQAAWGLLKKPAIAVRPANHPGVTPAKAVWRGTNAMPSWSFRGCDGYKAVVEVYSDGHTVELLINGKRVSRKPVKKFKAVFKTRYVPGKIEAISFDRQGKETGRSALESAAGALQVRVAPEVETIHVGELAYIDVSITGANGFIESNADMKLSVDVQNGELLAFGSANPRTEESYLSGVFTTYYGKAQAVVCGTKPGVIKVTVRGGNIVASAQILVEGGSGNGGEAEKA
jgi:hypothetical protein